MLAEIALPRAQSVLCVPTLFSGLLKLTYFHLQLGKRKAEPNQSNQNYDFARTFRFFAYGFAISPFLGRWNAFLESRFPLTRAIAPARSPQTQSRNFRTLRTRGGDWSSAQSMHTASQAPKVSWLALSKRVAADQSIMAPAGVSSWRTHSCVLIY